tara:strand:+ start:368 stop:865 length:498 start_codon:yes stop_codon:yes gene_type:complete
MSSESPLNTFNWISWSKNLGLFLILNFGALAIGALLQGEGPSSMWYSNLDRAPWTPPGWVFGAAWFSIMLCFAIYLANLSQKISLAVFLPLYAIHWIFNVSWNPLFFNWHLIGVALIVLLALTIVVGLLLYRFRKFSGNSSWLIAPYLIWLCIALSLNVYVLINN